MLQVIVTVGLSASGKSTWAREHTGYAVVSRDTIREYLIAGKWSPKKERQVVAEEDKIIRRHLSVGQSVIVDDTNLAEQNITRLKTIADEFGAEFVIKRFNVTLEEAIERDRVRGQKAVGETVLRQQWQKYIRPTLAVAQDLTLPRAIMVDIDGTLAHTVDRSPYQWDKVDTDTVDGPVKQVVSLYYKAGYQVIVISGRDSVSRPKTEAWLNYNGILYHHLYMRQENDVRPDQTVKRQLFIENVLPNYYVEVVLDDRQKVVDMWRDLGLKVFQVSEGRF